jgi:hypothetical protein
MNAEVPPAGRAAQFIDVCNGDADGLCAVVQWRLSRPTSATLVTGLKRDIELLERVRAEPGDEVLVCDISMQRNRIALARLLALGVRVRYFDHHGVTGIPTHPNLESHVELGPQVCTSLLMDRHLHGAFCLWALVGAYGDNLGAVADTMAEASGLTPAQRARLRMLGGAVNYNAYGDSLQDVFIAPAQLYRIMARYADPLELIEQESVIPQLARRRRTDLLHACAVAPLRESRHAAVRVLPDAPWSRRVMGSLAHELAEANPDQAQAVLRRTAAGHHVVSVRAPLNAPFGAGELCARFGGAGRSGAAGIDRLPEAELDRFVQAFDAETWNSS